MTTPLGSQGDGRSTLVGTAHTCSAAENLHACISLAYPGFRPEKEKMGDFIATLKSFQVGQTDTIVLDLISNLAHMRTYNDRLMTQAFRADNAVTT
jgi:hypothetical protein